MSVKILQLHKRASYEFKHIQDKYAFSEKTKCYAIADGTTQSFNSEKWAELITDSFAKKPIFEPKELIVELLSSANTFKKIKIDFSDNPAKASLEKEKQKKGGTATFVGVKIENNKLSLISCGDSNVFIFRNNQLIAFPFSTSVELDNNKHFLNTEKLLAEEVEESFFITKEFEIETSDVIILATDALSRLLLNNGDSFKHLLQTNDFETFKTLCLKYWEEKQMEEDDISAMIIRDFNSKDILEILPPKGFSFPKEEEIEFIPSSQMTPSLNQINENDMQQLLFTVNRISEELNQFKKKSKFHEMLLMLAVSLIAINIFLLFYLRPEQPESNAKEMQNDFKQELNEKENIIQQQTEEIDKLNKKLKSKDTTIIKKEEKVITAKPQVENKAKQQPIVEPKKKMEVKDTSKNEPSKKTPKNKD